MRTHAPASHPAQAAAPRRGRRPSLASSAALAPPPAPATAGGRAGGALSMARDLRASMADDPTLSAYMAGLRGSGQSTADFASSTTRMEVVEAEGAAGDELPLSYDPAAIARFWSKRPKAVVQRILQLLGISGGFLGRLAWDAYRGQLAETEVARAIELREIVTSLGPAYIKLGQALSIRPDLLSPAAMRELQKLCDKVPSFPNATAMALIEKELGAPWTAFYATLGPDPVAAASLGQVYQGTLLSTGETVAVKVQRPYVLETVTVDLYVIRSVFAFLRRFEVPTDLVGLLDEWAARFFEELDYVREGENATRFGAMMAADLPQVVVPRTYSAYTSRRVLTSSWLEGEKLSQSQEKDVGELVSVGVVCYLKQLLDTGFFHADPHPGNLIRTPDGRLAILDFGLMTQISDDVKYGMIEAISHLIHRDYEAIAKDFVTLEFIDPKVDLKPLLPVLARVFDAALEGGGAKAFNFQALAGDLAQITFDYPFRIPPYFALIIRAIGVLEGIALVDEAYPFIAQKLLSDPSPRLRAALTYMVYGRNRVLDADRLIDLLQSYEAFVTASRSGRGAPPPPAAPQPPPAALPPAAAAAAAPATPAAPLAPRPAAPAAKAAAAAAAAGAPPPPSVAREALTFLFSPSGLFFRDFVLDEVAAGLDAAGRAAAASALAALAPAPLLALRLPVLLPFAPPGARLSLAPEVTDEDRAVVANAAKLLSFLFGGPGGSLAAAAGRPQASGGATPAQVLAELGPLLPAVAAEVAPQLARRLASRLAARAIRDLYLPAGMQDGGAARGAAAVAR